MILAFDLETTIHLKGHVFSPKNRIVCYSYATKDKAEAILWTDGKDLQLLLNAATTIVVFNGKFDCQWITREGLTYDPRKVWDVQLGYFIQTHQRNSYPSLNGVCIAYGMAVKPDVVKGYWDKGIDTPDIPWEILEEYAVHDAVSTLSCYYHQVATMNRAMMTLVRLQSQDMSILRDMEWHGLLFDEEHCHVRAAELDDQISAINTKLSQFYPSTPINFNSNHHLSAFLYGGCITEESKEHVGFYKTGLRAGEPKYANIQIEHQLPRIYEPLKGSEKSVTGVFAVDEGTLRKLKGPKAVVTLLLELAKLSKLNTTYYRGLTKLREKMEWEHGIIHGNFNQCVAVSGRLSSSKPNLQNMAGDIQGIFISEYVN